MTVTILEDFKSKLIENVCNEITMPVQSDDDTELLVNPKCFLGGIPSLGVVDRSKPIVERYTIPAICICVDDIIDNNDCQEIHFTLGFAVNMLDYGNDTINNGYIDLFNLIDKTKAYLLRDSFNFDFMIINGEIKTTIPPISEQVDSFWFGYMQFTAKCKAYPNYDVEKYL